MSRSESAGRYPKIDARMSFPNFELRTLSPRDQDCVYSNYAGQIGTARPYWEIGMKNRCIDDLLDEYKMVVYDHSRDVLRDTITESGPYYIINSVQLQKLLSREIQELQSRSAAVEADLKARKAQQEEAERKGYLIRTPESTGTGFNQPEDYMEAYKRHQQAHFGISPHASATVGMTAIQPHQQISEIEGWKRGRVQTMAPYHLSYPILEAYRSAGGQS